MADLDIPYIAAYRSVRRQRAGEMSQLRQQVEQYTPGPRILLGIMFFALGVAFAMLFPPMGAIAGIVGVISIAGGIKIGGQRRILKRALSDEEFRWNLRDTAIEKLGDEGFQTLCRALEGNGSYDSLSGWMTRKGLDRDEGDALILAAAVAGDERKNLLARVALGPRVHPAAAALTVAKREEMLAESFGAETDEGVEGLHARQLREADERDSGEGPARRPGAAQPARSIAAESAAGGGSEPAGEAGKDFIPALEGGKLSQDELARRIAIANARKAARGKDKLSAGEILARQSERPGSETP